MTLEIWTKFFSAIFCDEHVSKADVITLGNNRAFQKTTEYLMNDC